MSPARTSIAYKDYTYTAHVSSPPTSTQPHIIMEPEPDRSFPPEKIRHSIERHIHQRRYSPPEGSEGQRYIQKEENCDVEPTNPDTGIPPQQPPKRREKEHPFKDGVRDFKRKSSDSSAEAEGQLTNYRDESEEECVDDNSTRTQNPNTGDEGQDNICRCDTAIKKYCLRGDTPFCVCSRNANGQDTNCIEGNPKIVTRPHDGGVPIGSKFYAHGERSKNRNRQRCKDPAMQRDGSAPNPRTDKDKDKNPPQRKSRGLFQYKNPDVNPKNKSGDQGEKKIQEQVLSDSTVDSTVSEDTIAKKHKHGKDKAGPHQGTQRSRHRHNSTGCICGLDPCILCLLLLLWLLLLTLYILIPGPYGLFGGIMTKIEQCRSLMYSGVEP